MSEDLLDLAALHSQQPSSSTLPSTPGAQSTVPRTGTPSTPSPMSDILSLSSNAAANSPAIPRFEVSPPEPSALLPRPSASPAPPTSSSSSAPSTGSNSSAAGSAMSQLQELWYPQLSKSPSRDQLSSSQASSATDNKSVLPPVMSVSPAPTEAAPGPSQPATGSSLSSSVASATTSLSHSRTSVTTASSAADSPAQAHVESSPTQKLPPPASSAALLSASASSAQVTPPFALWSPDGTQEHAAAAAPNPLSVSQSKYSVTTVATPPGTVDQETLGVMKDMLKSMSDMTRRMLTLEERVSRLEMEKEILSRTVNRLQEAQHQQAVRHEMPKQVLPAANPAPIGAWPPGYPPVYGTVNTSYAGVPPGYVAPMATAMQPYRR